MMRELKFRLWCPKRKAFHYWGFVTEGNGFPCFAGIPDGMLREAQENSEQFTGLKDKNLKDIYEGDIVKLRNGDIAEVRWMDDCFLLVDKENNDNAIYYTDSYLSQHNDTASIIGNIHETEV